MHCHAYLYDGRVKFYNFTHYDTGDMARMFEAAYRLIKAGNAPEHQFNVHAPKEIHLCYKRGKTGDRVSRGGSRYYINGIRIRRKDDLIANPLEALATNMTELPRDVALELLNCMNAVYLHGGNWFDHATRRNVRVDMSNLPIVCPIRINEDYEPLPKGYMSRSYANARVRRARRRSESRLDYAVRNIAKSLIALESSSKYVNFVNGSAKDPTHISTQMRDTLRQLRSLHREVEAFFNINTEE